MEDLQNWDRLMTLFFEKDLIKQGMYTYWMLWNNRNDYLHNMRCRNPNTLKLIAINRAKEYSETVQGNSTTSHVSKKEWTPPPRNCYKINVDATYNTTTRVARLGAAARDEEVRIGFLAITKVEGIESSLQAETLAILFRL